MIIIYSTTILAAGHAVFNLHVFHCEVSVFWITFHVRERSFLPVALGNQIICVKWFTCLSEAIWSPRNPAKVLHESLTFTMRTTKIRFFCNEQIFITRTSSPFAAKELQETRSSSLKDNGKTRGWHLVCKKEWPCLKWCLNGLQAVPFCNRIASYSQLEWAGTCHGR